MLDICVAIFFTLYLFHCPVFFGLTSLLRTIDQLTKNIINKTNVRYLCSHLLHFISLSLPCLLWIDFLT